MVKSVPYCKQAVVKAFIDSLALSPDACDNVFTATAILFKASGLLAKSGPNLDKIPLKDSMLSTTPVPNWTAKSLAFCPKPSKSFPVTPVKADISLRLAS